MLKISSTSAETIQDLLRFLRRDVSRERPVMMQLHAWNLVEKDVLPLILTYHDHVTVDASKAPRAFCELYVWCSQRIGVLSCSQTAGFHDVTC